MKTINELLTCDYGWREVAVLYSPPHIVTPVAKRLVRWVHRIAVLASSLRRTGWPKGLHTFTPLYRVVSVHSLGKS